MLIEFELLQGIVLNLFLVITVFLYQILLDFRISKL